YAESHGYAAAKPTSKWNIASNIAGKLEGLALCGCEKFSRCISNHCADHAAFASADRYIVVKRKRYSKTIETRPEIRSAGWNTQRMFERFLPKRNQERQAPKLILGDSNIGSHGVVIERGLRFEIDFSGGYSVGLFIDQRENRSFVRKSAPKQMLNCFAYTCSF